MLMKKVVPLFAVLILLITQALSAQTAVTVADSTVSNSAIPLYGMYMNEYLRNQVVYPASMLKEMENVEISAITFYLRTLPAEAWTATFKVKLGITNTEVFAIRDYLTDPMTTLYTGTMAISPDGTLTIHFDHPFLYEGGNLLLEIATETVGNYKSAYFYGAYSPSGSIYGYNSNGVSAITYAYVQNFIPKTTFTVNYMDTCSARWLQLSDIMGSSAFVTWMPPVSGNSSAYELSYKADTATNWTVVTNNLTEEHYLLTGLQQQTKYQVRVRALCSDGFSGYITRSFSTGCLGGNTEPVVIGNTTSGVNYLPTNPYYKYSYSQQIYRANEIGGARDINQIAVQYFYSSSLSRLMDIYLGHTEKGSFSTNGDWVPLADLTKVYSGTITFNNNGENYWFTIPFDTTFAYNGTDNLVVVFDDNTGSYESSYAHFYGHQSESNSSLYHYSDNTNDDPASPYTSASRNGYRMNIWLPGQCISDGCDRANVIVTNVTDSSAQFTIASGNGAIGREMYYKRADSDQYIPLPTTSSNTVLLTGLMHNTRYNVRIRSLCSSEASNWKEITFTTMPRNYSKLYVTTNGTGTGSSWADACSDLNWALSTAAAIRRTFSHAPDVWVAQGTYYGDSVSASAFTMADGINVYGGFVGNEDDNYNLSLRDLDAHATILDGQNSQRVLYQSDNFNFSSTWDGFTIQNGYSTGNGGGACLMYMSSLRNCKILHNTGYNGGGVYADGSSSSNPIIIENCVFSHNTATNYGGGLFNRYAAARNCVFDHNRSETLGGGIYIYSAYNNYTCVYNCLITNNTAKNGGGIYNDSYSSFLLNNTIVNNSVTENGAGLYAAGLYKMANSIIYGNRTTANQVSSIYNNGSLLNCTNSAVEGGFSGEGNIALMSEDLFGGIFAPKFVHPAATAGYTDSTANIDWRLQQGSICVNRGSNMVLPHADSTGTDLDGNARIQHDTVDIGCYESGFPGISLPASGSIVYVTPSGSGSRNGSSWDNAMADLNLAQILAGMNNADVWVAQGIYYGDTLGDNAFVMCDGVNVYGGFVGNEAETFDLSLRDVAAHPTILDGKQLRRVLSQPNGFNNRTIWDGFIIRNGYSTENGGGAYLYYNSELRHCIIQNNRSDKYGGGIYAYGINSSEKACILDHCTITHNEAVSGGGGIVNRNAMMRHCEVTHNVATYYSSSGGGVYIENGNSYSVSNCLIANNTAGYGGGIYSGSYTAVVENTTIVRNMASYTSSSYNGGGVYGSGTVHNSIVWGNRMGEESSNVYSNITCTYTAVEDGFQGENNISLLPQDFENGRYFPYFVNPSVTAGYMDSTANTSWRLLNGSICVNRGSNELVTIPDSTDLDGNARVRHGIVDLGCYESDHEGIVLPHYGNIIYVTQTGNGTREGNNWANACSDIGTALSLARMYNTDIWVAEGIYYGDTTGYNAFTMMEGINVYGGFAGNEGEDFDLSSRDFDAHPTILDGQNTRRVLVQTESFKKITKWDGFTIQNGYISGTGGGAYLRVNSLLSNCTITHNLATGSGGGIYGYGYNSSYTDSIYLQNCTFIDNTTNSSGGGAYISSNSSLLYCTFTHNTSHSNSGGLYAYTSNISCCTFTHNKSGSNAGGLTAEYSRVSNCLVANNTSYGNGGGMYGYGNISNCTFVNNESTYSNSCGGFYSSYTSRTYMTNCIVWGNRNKGKISNITGTFSCSYTAVEGGKAGEGNILILTENTGSKPFYPFFVHPSDTVGSSDSTLNADWRLTSNSPCINHGVNVNVGATDLAGNPRIQKDTIDIGCYESEYNGVHLPNYGSIIYVTEHGSGNQSGEDWNNATSSIQEALEVASTYSADVWVAAGTYYGNTNSNNAFIMKEGVNAYGGFVGNEPANYDLSLRNLDSNATILDGQSLRRVLYQADHFQASTPALWDGFTIQNGAIYENGAGVYMQAYSSLRNCIIQNNYIYYKSSNNSWLLPYGAGVYANGAYSSSTGWSGSIQNCIIRNNTAENVNNLTVNGGGIYAVNIYVSHTEISHNSTPRASGGGVYANNNTKFSNCLIYGNSAQTGGGVYMNNNNCSLVNCDIIFNSTTISNSSGAGIHRGGYPTVTNCIVYGNKANYVSSNIYDPYGYGTYTYCAVEDGFNGMGNITLASTNDGFDPTVNYVRFMDPDQEDFRLHPTSSCINIGNNSVMTDNLDFYGSQRIYGNIVDIGCSEAQEQNNCPSVIGLRAENITTNSARLVWHPVGNETQWLVVYGEVGGQTQSMTVSDTFCTIQNLSLNRHYAAKVRSICDNSLTSIFSVIVNFQTQCNPDELTPPSDFSNMLPTNGQILYSNQMDFSWNALEHVTSYDFYLWAANEEAPTTPTRSGLTQPMANDVTLPHYSAGKVYYWKVVAWNECVSKTSPVMSLQANWNPDLHVSSIENSTPVATQQMTVTWTVSNDGQGNTPPGITWNDYIWLSPIDGVGGGFWYNVSEILLATVPNVQSLNAGESYQNSVTVTIPTDYVGSYFLFVMTDQHDARDIDFSITGHQTAPNPYTPSVSGNPYPYLSGTIFRDYNQITEGSGHENDNFFYKVITIQQPPTPDLVVSSVVHGGNALSGYETNVSWTVTNQGDATAMGEWTDVVYLSRDTVLSTVEDLRLVRYTHSGPLAANESYQHSEQVTIPVDFLSGNYYYIVITDNNNTLYEGINEQNNISMSQPLAVTMSWLTDLEISAVTMPTAVDVNGQYTCSFTVTNNGSSPTFVSQWRDEIYFCQEATFNPQTAIKLVSVPHSGVLDAGSSYNVSAQFTIPNYLTGNGYLFVMVDYYDAVFEYNAENNNVYTQAETILLPDLQVANIYVPDEVSTNAPTTIRWTMRNNGPGNLISRAFYDRIFLNNEEVYQITVNNLSIAAGDSIVRTVNLQLPCPSGNGSTLTIVADYTQLVGESNEDNNSKAMPLTMKDYDMALTGFTTQDTAVWSGTPAVLSYIVTNTGTEAITNTQVTDYFYLSTSPTSYQESDLIGRYTHNMNLAVGRAADYTCTVTVPNGLNGTYYYHIVCNADTAICENGNYSNNHAHYGPIEVSLSPSADLVVSQLAIPAQTYLGAEFELNYVIRNQGTAALQGTTVTQKFYYSRSPISYDTTKLLASVNDVLNLAVGDSVALTTYAAIPTNEMVGQYYVYLVTDANNQLYEHNGENNNQKISNATTVSIYQLDLKVTEIDGPDVLQWGQTATYRLHVVNTSTKPTLVRPWHDVIYLSPDQWLNPSDQQMSPVAHNAVLEAGADYWTDLQVTIPLGTPSSVYLIAITDFNSVNPDIDPTNNSKMKVVTINSIPTPDLAIGEVEVLDDILSGQPSRIAYKVTNVGEVPIVNYNWNDRLFLSPNSSYESDDYLLLTQNRSRMSLAVNEYYRDTLAFTVPLPKNGNFHLLLTTNIDNNMFESNQSNNIAGVPIQVVLPPPGDLIVKDISSESSVVSGEVLHVTWTLQNIGDNTLTGNGLRSLVYISADTVFDVNDRLLGSITNAIYLPMDQSMPMGLNGRISGLKAGNYYLIVKTDVTNAFNEVDENNNSGHTTVPFTVAIRTLPFNTDVADTLVNNEPSDFILNVDGNVNQTVRIHLTSEDSLANAVNMIYTTHNDIGDNLNYNYSTIGQYTANPTLYIPSTLPGYYGVNVYGSTPAGNSQNTVIRADILPFELHAVNDNHGGNTGEVTVELTGSRFRPDMIVSLRNAQEEITADTLIYVNYYQAFARFNLAGKTPGVYDVHALTLCEGEATLHNGFTIENGQPMDVSYNLVFPSSPRPNRSVVMLLEFGNTGNVDLRDQVLEITSLGGSPIALTPEGVSQNNVVLRVPLTIEGEPQGLLRPGSYGSINIYTYTSGALMFTIKPVEE